MNPDKKASCKGNLVNVLVIFEIRGLGGLLAFINPGVPAFSTPHSLAGLSQLVLVFPAGRTPRSFPADRGESTISWGVILRGPS